MLGLRPGTWRMTGLGEDKKELSEVGADPEERGWLWEKKLN